jgi:hypothetical protein
VKQHYSVISLIGKLCLAFVLVDHAAIAADAPLPNVAAHQTVGTVNCASSTCHGAVTPWNATSVLQNEYTTWIRLDKHAKAYSVLLNEQSRSIAKKLGLKQGAHESALCLDCHAQNPAPALRGERHVLSEGVGCEACHGPAEQWIKSHTVPGTPHAENVAHGMYPTERPVQQAKLCLSCHVGDATRYVSHRLMGAGHPRISFELDSFSQIAPPHYRIDEDWHKRKGEYDNVRIWAVGQALASKNLLDMLADPKRGRDGLFPELALFDCYACHHPMSEKKWTPRLGVGPGRMRLNDSNLLMLRAIVRAVDPSRADAFSDQIMQLHQTVAGNSEVRGADPLAVATKLSSTIEQYIVRFEKQHFDVALQRAIFNALLDEAARNEFADYAGAEQAYLSITSLVSSLGRQGALTSIAKVNQHLTRMRKILANEENFRPDAFASELLALRDSISPQRR